MHDMDFGHTFKPPNFKKQTKPMSCIFYLNFGDLKMRYLLALLCLIFIFGCEDKEPHEEIPTEPPRDVPVVKPIVVTPEDEQTVWQSFNAPWDNHATQIIIDAYSGNSIDWDKMAADKRMVAVVHRLAYGSRRDSKYDARKAEAKKRGYLWGAYHLPLKGNTIAQAKLMVKEIKASPGDLMALDLEDTTGGKFMSLDEAKVYMDYVYQQTGKVLPIYANHHTTKLLSNKFKNDPIISKAQLWYARFKSHVTDYPNDVWPNYFLWQFSSEINCSKTGSCLYNVPGTRFDMDVNVYWGSFEDLEKEWAL